MKKLILTLRNFGIAPKNEFRLIITDLMHSLILEVKAGDLKKVGDEDCS
jgi:hypothetical protein